MFMVQLSCGGGGSGGPTAPSGSLVFSPDRAPGASSFSMRQGSATSGDRLELEIVATSVSDVSSVSFVVSYPANLLRFAAQRQGTFLGSAAALVATPLPAPFQGLVVIDARPNAAGGVTGSGVVMTLAFDAAAPGSSRIDFASPEARDSQDRAIAGLGWVGGTVTVIR